MSLSLGILGMYGALMACVIAVLCPMLSLFPTRYRAQWQYYAIIAAWVGVTLGFATLIWGHASSHFAIAHVARTTHSTLPLFYKITSAWGSHEGSMLLWLWLHATVMAICALCYRQADWAMHLLQACASIVLLLLLYTLFLSNPLERIWPIPLEGRGFNPLLQDPALAIHPPLLYMGYVAFMVPFAAVSVLLREGRFNRPLLFAVYPWLLGGVAFLTAGVTLGSWWAYRELGWGGYWFWDPVENVSLLPWLTGLATFHCWKMAQSQQTYVRWALCLALITYGMVLIASVVVRSGGLISVHSFALSEERARGLLLIMALVMMAGFALYAARARTIVSLPTPLLAPSRISALWLQSLALLWSAGVILFALFYPDLYQATTGKIVAVGAPFYHITLLPVWMALAGWMALTLPWKWLPGPVSWVRVLSITLGLALPLYAMFRDAWIASSLVVMLAILYTHGRHMIRRPSLKAAMTSLPMIGAHLSVVLLMGGMILGYAQGDERMEVMAEGDSLRFHDFTLRYDEERRHATSHSLHRVWHMTVTDAEGRQQSARPEIRYFPVENTQTSESVQLARHGSHLYLVVGSADDAKRISLHLYWRPGIMLLWIGGMMMALCTGASMVRHVLGRRWRNV